MSAVEFTEEELELRHAKALPRRALPHNDSAERVAANIAEAHGVLVGDMMSERRSRHLVEARRDLYLALRSMGWSYPAIGRFVGNRDHTTVMAAIDATTAQVDRWRGAHR